MRFEEGDSFEAWLRSLVRPPSQEELDRIVAPLLEALQMMHAKDFLHRDIAPDNILVRRDGSPVLLDFGRGCSEGKCQHRAHRTRQSDGRRFRRLAARGQRKLKDKSAPPHQRLPSRRAPRPPRGAMGGAPQMPSPRGRPPAPGRGAAERAGAGCSTTPHARTAPGAPVGRPPVDASASERNFSAGSCRRPEFAG